MAYPLIEHPLGDAFFYNGECCRFSSVIAGDLFKPSDECTYYETVRIVDGMLLFVEDHMRRLELSVKGLEDFSIDTDMIVRSAYNFIKYSRINFGNIRIVLTANKLIIHQVDVHMPDAEDFRVGINTSVLNWERQTPNLKIFRGDYKDTVNKAFSKCNSHGAPFELLLADNCGKLYEGSMSNLFVIMDGTVYSAPDDKILIGITRRRVIEALRRSGLSLACGMFSIDELSGRDDTALFVSSTPFDILPISFVDEYAFNSVGNPVLRMISDEYQKYTLEYIRRGGKNG